MKLSFLSGVFKDYDIMRRALPSWIYKPEVHIKIHIAKDILGEESFTALKGSLLSISLLV